MARDSKLLGRLQTDISSQKIITLQEQIIVS